MTYLNITNASPTNSHRYQNQKRKLYNCNLNIYFNKKLLPNNKIPKFAIINIPKNSPASKITQRKSFIPKFKMKLNIYFFKRNLLHREISEIYKVTKLIP